jgi:hypothetical protein
MGRTEKSVGSFCKAYRKLWFHIGLPAKLKGMMCVIAGILPGSGHFQKIASEVFVSIFIRPQLNVPFFVGGEPVPDPLEPCVRIFEMHRVRSIALEGEAYLDSLVHFAFSRFNMAR